MKKLIVFPFLLVVSLFSFGQEDINICYYTYVEDMPMFNGAKELRESLKLLNEYLEKRVESDNYTTKGTVRLGFLIDPTGVPVEIELINGVDPSIDSLAIKYLEEMPLWKPGKAKGEAVYVRETVAIKFE